MGGKQKQSIRFGTGWAQGCAVALIAVAASLPVACGDDKSNVDASMQYGY